MLTAVHAKPRPPSAPMVGRWFERAERACLHHSAEAAQLLQAEERRICALAVQALTSDAPQAAMRAQENLDALLHALERPLPRAVIRRALNRLDRAAGVPAHAAQIVAWARGKLPRHDPRYSQEAMLSLVARQLERYPGLRGVAEQPTVYRRDSGMHGRFAEKQG